MRLSWQGVASNEQDPLAASRGHPIASQPLRLAEAGLSAPGFSSGFTQFRVYLKLNRPETENTHTHTHTHTHTPPCVRERQQKRDEPGAV
jgi:hypothetical protein